MMMRSVEAMTLLKLKNSRGMSFYEMNPKRRTSLGRITCRAKLNKHFRLCC